MEFFRGDTKSKWKFLGKVRTLSESACDVLTNCDVNLGEFSQTDLS